MSPWHLACESGQPNRSYGRERRLLCDRQINCRSVDVVRLLLDRFGSHLTTRERRGTAHFLALRNECHDVVRLLVRT